MTTKIVRAVRSPMNGRRWLCELTCGHEQWVTQGSKPKEGKPVTCDTCAHASRGGSS